MLSRKKGKRYGEGHQKALQISVCMLPLARVRMLEGVVCLPGLRHTRNAWHLSLYASFLSCCWESAPRPTRRRCREIDDGLSDHEAAEMAARTLLLRWRPCRWEELQLPLKSAMWLGVY